MAAASEPVLISRVCGGAGCARLFWICHSCYRGQRYCSLPCHSETRRRQRREANRRHQASPEGRLDHRDRQRAYRRRLAARSRVTDQSSSACSISGTVLRLAPETTALRVPSRRPARIGLLSCWVCGRLGRWVNPFRHRE